MPKDKTETAIQAAFRARREAVRADRASKLVALADGLRLKPGPLTAEAKEYLADVEAMTDDQLDDEDASSAMFDRGQALRSGAQSQAGQRGDTFRY